MSPRGDGPFTSRLRARRNGEQGQIPTKPPYLCRTSPWAKSRRTQEAAQRTVWPKTWSVGVYRLAQCRYGGVAQVHYTWRLVWYLPYGDEAFSKCPLFSTDKRRLPPPHLNNNTQEKSTRAREEQHHSWA